MSNNTLSKILVVDDEQDILDLVRYNLEKEGYEVHTAINGQLGYELAKEIIPEVILLDIMMPEIDGVELCRRLRLDAELSDTVIAFLTARNEDFTQIAAFEAGGDDFITKPIRPRVLNSRIKALIRRSGRTSASNSDHILEFGDLKIDQEQFAVILSGKKIDLAKKEFELLHLLASKPGKVFTRDEIFRRIWGPGVIVGTRTIDVHIRKLREKFGDDYIRTVKGIGYKFES